MVGIFECFSFFIKKEKGKQMGIPKKMKTLTARTANKVLHDTSMTWHGHSSCCSYLQIVSHCQLASEWATAPPTFLTLHLIMAISTRSRNNNILQSHFCAKKDYYATWFFLKSKNRKKIEIRSSFKRNPAEIYATENELLMRNCASIAYRVSGVWFSLV